MVEEVEDDEFDQNAIIRDWAQQNEAQDVGGDEDWEEDPVINFRSDQG